MDDKGQHIVVKVLRAKGLKNVDFGLAGHSDPFFVARIGAKVKSCVKFEYEYSPLHVTCKLCTSHASPYISANIDHF